jgi:hypothetical protein
VKYFLRLVKGGDTIEIQVPELLVRRQFDGIIPVGSRYFMSFRLEDGCTVLLEIPREYENDSGWRFGGWKEVKL